MNNWPPPHTHALYSAGTDAVVDDPQAQQPQQPQTQQPQQPQFYDTAAYLYNQPPQPPPPPPSQATGPPPPPSSSHHHPSEAAVYRYNHNPQHNHNHNHNQHSRHNPLGHPHSHPHSHGVNVGVNVNVSHAPSAVGQPRIAYYVNEDAAAALLYGHPQQAPSQSQQQEAAARSMAMHHHPGDAGGGMYATNAYRYEQQQQPQRGRRSGSIGGGAGGTGGYDMYEVRSQQQQGHASSDGGMYVLSSQQQQQSQQHAMALQHRHSSSSVMDEQQEHMHSRYRHSHPQQHREQELSSHAAAASALSLMSSAAASMSPAGDYGDDEEDLEEIGPKIETIDDDDDGGDDDHGQDDESEGDNDEDEENIAVNKNTLGGRIEDVSMIQGPSNHVNSAFSTSQEKLIDVDDERRASASSQYTASSLKLDMSPVRMPKRSSNVVNQSGDISGDNYRNDRRRDSDDIENGSQVAEEDESIEMSITDNVPRGKTLRGEVTAYGGKQIKILDEDEESSNLPVDESSQEDLLSQETPGSTAKCEYEQENKIQESQSYEKLFTKPMVAKPKQHETVPKTNTANGKRKRSVKEKSFDDDHFGSGVVGHKTMAGVMGTTPITDAEYECAKELMDQFLQVPLLTEFIRPCLELNPELKSVYMKIIKRPMDLGQVCRKIKERVYVNINSLRLDVWRVFSNCIAFHSHSSAKDIAIPTFISVSLHLREFFNALWAEYMIPSEIPNPFRDGTNKSKKVVSAVRSIFAQRDEARQARLVATISTSLSCKCLKKASRMISRMVSHHGRVDGLDVEACLQEGDEASVAFRVLQERLLELADANEGNENADDNSFQSQITIADLTRDMKACADLMMYPELSEMLNRRMDRIVGKLVIPLFEAGCRGVDQSSIWGCMAAAVWARENRKKPFWPGIVLGIIAPEHQREGWHEALTDRNEGRLPKHLQSGLSSGKRKAEQHMKKPSGEQMSYFLVEFMGSHEFAWVREADLVDNFDPTADPNELRADGTSSSKKRVSRSATINTSSELFLTSVEECKWAQAEFERQVGDPCGDFIEPQLSEGIPLSFKSLSQLKSVEVQVDDESDYEAEELFENEGLLDYSPSGRKRAKQKAAKAKKQKIEAEKAAKNRAEKAKKAKLKKTETSIKKKKSSPEGVFEKLAKPAKSTVRSNPETNMPITKKERAAFKVKEVVGQLQRQDGWKGSGNIGVVAGGIVESNLLAMALAFRSAAGEIPDPSGIISKPWEVIDDNSPLEANKRCISLRKKIELVKEEIIRMTEVKMRRDAFIIEMKKEREREIKRLKSMKSPSSKSAAKKRGGKARKKAKISTEPVKVPSDDEKTTNTINSANIDNETVATKEESKEIETPGHVETSLILEDSQSQVSENEIDIMC